MMMSIAALERTSNTTTTTTTIIISNRIEGSGFISGGFSSSSSSCMSKSNFVESTTEEEEEEEEEGDQLFPSSSNMGSIKEPEKDLDSCSSSSIGRNSDLLSMSSSSMDEDDDDDDDDDDTEEVQSSLKGPLDTMDALVEVLPIRRGISKFYCGKSKSFTSLADASTTSSVKDLAKSDDAFTRKRKNLLANSNILEKNRNISPLRSSSSSSSNIGGISKRPTNSNRSTLGMGVVGASSSESYNTNEENSNSSSSSPRLRPPLHPPPAKSSLNNAAAPSVSPPQRKFSSWRSFSLTDLQGAANSSTDSSIGNRDGPIKKLN